MVSTFAGAVTGRLSSRPPNGRPNSTRKAIKTSPTITSGTIHQGARRFTGFVGSVVVIVAAGVAATGAPGAAGGATGTRRLFPHFGQKSAPDGGSGAAQFAQ